MSTTIMNECIHCERFLDSIYPNPIIVCGDCLHVLSQQNLDANTIIVREEIFDLNEQFELKVVLRSKFRSKL